MPYYYEQPVNDSVSTLTNAAIWLIVALILSIIGGVCFYFFFLKNEKQTNNKYLDWLKEFFNFKKMLIEDLFKILYVVLTIFITLYSFVLIGSNFLGFILVLTVGNLVLRLSFESILIMIMIWKNTTEMNKKMKK